MKTLTPETDTLVKTLIETRGMTNAVFTAEITSKCEMLERQRNAALEDLAFRRDLYRRLKERYVRQYAELVEALAQRNAAIDDLRTLTDAISQFGGGASMLHPRITRAISAARKTLANYDEPATK